MKKSRLSPYVLILFLGGAAVLLALGESPGAAQETVLKNCAICHGKQSYRRVVTATGEIADLYVDDKVLAASVHHNRTCSDCHADIQTVPHEGYVPKPVDCTRCHYLGNPVGAPQSEGYRIFAESAHGQALAAGKEKAPRCQDCHGTHNIRHVKSPDNPLSPRNVGHTCGSCHRDEYNAWIASEHGKALMEGEVEAPTCINCHGEHGILSPDDPRSTVAHGNVPESCAHCHDEKEIIAKFDVPAERVETYERSFHAIAIRFGSKVAANCASCHGYHDILHSSNPLSKVNVANVPSTCGQANCHPGAGVNYAIGKVHVNPEDQESGLVFYISSFFKYFTAAVIFGLVFHIVLDLGRRILGPRRGKKEPDTTEVSRDDAR